MVVVGGYYVFVCWELKCVECGFEVGKGGYFYVGDVFEVVFIVVVVVYVEGGVVYW